MYSQTVGSAYSSTQYTAALGVKLGVGPVGFDTRFAEAWGSILTQASR